MRSHVFVRAAAVAAVTALGGAAPAGLAPPVSAATPAKDYDFNGDGYVDLALGSPDGKVGAKAGAGFVSVIYGSGSGPNTGDRRVFTQSSTGIPGTPEPYDHFGSSLASADFDRDGYADLVIGAPGENGGDGAVTFLKSRGAGGFLPVSGAKGAGTGVFGVSGRNAQLGRVIGR